MIQQFFIALIKSWIQDFKYKTVCLEAICFYYWLNDLMKVAFLPGQTSVDRRWRFKRVRQCITKMPAFSDQFYNCLKELTQPNALTRHEYNLIDAKRGNVQTLVEWLKNIDEGKVEQLQAMLLKPHQERFIRKRNKQRASR